MTAQPAPTGPRLIHAHWCETHDDPSAGCLGPKIPYGDGEDDWLFLAQREDEPLDVVVGNPGLLTVERAIGLADALDAAITMAETPGHGLTPDPRSAA